MSSASSQEQGIKWWVRYAIVPIIGGGGLVAIIIALLARPAPAAARQQVQVTNKEGQAQGVAVEISPDEQAITQQDLGRLDRNVFHVDEQLEIAIHLPASDEWEINTDTSIPTVGLVDVPVMEMGLTLYRSLYDQNPLTVFGVRQREGHEITLLEDSKVESIPMNLNLFENTEYLRAVLKAQMEMTASMGIPSPEITDEMLSQVQTLLSESYRTSLKDTLPAHKQVHNGVYVMPVFKEYLDKSVLREMIPRSTLLDEALQFLTLTGYFSMGSLKNLTVDQERGFASFNASARLEGVEIDGRQTDAVVNNIGFLVAGKERAVFVELIYLSVDDVSVYESLRDLLDSLRFTN